MFDFLFFYGLEFLLVTFLLFCPYLHKGIPTFVVGVTTYLVVPTITAYQGLFTEYPSVSLPSLFYLKRLLAPHTFTFQGIGLFP